MAISEEDLRGLSAVEREALLAADENDEDIVHELGARGDAPRASRSEPEDEPDDEATGAPAPAPAPAAPAPAPAAPPADAPATPTPAPAADTPAAPAPAPVESPAAAPAAADDDDYQPQRRAPADIDDQRNALTAREDEAFQKLMDGEMTQEDFNKVKGEVRAKGRELDQAEAEDLARASVRQEQMEREYSGARRDILKEGRAAGLNYDDPKVKAQFDGAVQMFANQFLTEGLSDSPGNLANSRAALAEAHAFMLRRHGKTAPAPAPSPAASTPAPAPAPAAAAPAGTPAPGPREPVDRSQLGVTLAAAPAAADPRITSEFAHLDGITEPAALERELAKLTPEQQERYLGA